MQNSIIDLLQNDGFSPIKATANEYFSPCPGCGGVDRFRCWPDTGRWWCRVCKKKGDLPGYLMEFHNLRYPAACQQLNIESKRLKPSTQPPPPRRWTPKLSEPPNETWQDMGSKFVEFGISELWKNDAALNYLMGRGLTAETIKDANLGYNPKAFFLDRETWGLPEKLKNNRPVKLWLPRGWVIPVYQGQLCRIKIRRPDIELKPDDKKYIHISGGQMVSMVMGAKPVAVIVEAEFDSILLHQEAGNLICPVALGSANIRPDRKTTKILKAAKHIILALDADQAGARESWHFWAENFPNANRWPVPGGKDATEAYQAGIDLNAWVRGVLSEIGGETAVIQEQPVKLIEDINGNSGDSKPVWCGTNCLKGERKQIEGLPVLWCQVSDMATCELPRCPLDHWTRNDAGRPIDVG